MSTAVVNPCDAQDEFEAARMLSAQDIPEIALTPLPNVHCERELDALDASFFSGDGFHSEHGIARARFFIARWSRELDAIEQMLKDSASEGNEQ